MSAILINPQKLYNMLAIRPSDARDCSAPLPLDLRDPGKFGASRIRTAVNLYFPSAPLKLNAKMLEQYISTDNEGIERFRWRSIYNIVIYSEGDLQENSWESRVVQFLVDEKRTKGLFLLEGGYAAFRAKFPFRCVGTSVPYSPCIHELYPSQILPYLYLGNEQTSKSLCQLRNLGVTHVVNCAPECKNRFLGSIKYLNLPLEDDVRQELTSTLLSEAVQFIADARRSGNAALVHCLMGKSRSPSVVIAYLIRAESHSFDSAYCHVKSERPNIDINPGFMKQLSQLTTPAITRSSPTHSPPREPSPEPDTPLHSVN